MSLSKSHNFSFPICLPTPIRKDFRQCHQPESVPNMPSSLAHSKQICSLAILGDGFQIPGHPSVPRNLLFVLAHPHAPQSALLTAMEREPIPKQPSTSEIKSQILA